MGEAYAFEGTPQTVRDVIDAAPWLHDSDRTYIERMAQQPNGVAAAIAYAILVGLAEGYHNPASNLSEGGIDLPTNDSP